jgi:hypothetical protein
VPRTLEETIAWAHANPKYTYKDGRLKGQTKSWAGLCEAFVNNAADLSSFPRAMLAGDASGPLDTDWAAAPAGSFHYWAGVGINGHVAFGLGSGMLLMASSRTNNMGVAIGTIHFKDYGLPLYRGWSMRHGTQRLAETAPAAITKVVVTPPIVFEETDHELKILNTPNNGGIYLSGPRGRVKIAGPADLNLLLRYLSAKNVADGKQRTEFYLSEIDFLTGNYLSKVL